MLESYIRTIHSIHLYIRVSVYIRVVLFVPIRVVQ